MAESQEQSTGWKRAKDLLKDAYVTGGVIAHTANPLAGPVTQQAHLDPVANNQTIAQQVEWDEIKQGADWEQLRREQEAGQVVHEPKSARPDPDPEPHPHPRQQPKHDASRNRQRVN
jgi:hypothetical protein